MGVPVLLAFIVLGMAFGTDGFFKIPFDNYHFAEQICSIALIFIMFYGGFGTNWREAKSVAVKSALLSTVGVFLTALLVGVFCYYILGFGLWESLLLGSVISSTDAASVFSILRSKKMGLQYHTDSMLELESGSNDPCSYMLTAIVLAVMGGGLGAGSALYMVFAQFFFGILCGFAIAWGARFVLQRLHFATAGFDMAFVIGIALLSYAAASLLGGNGYLSVYICGIFLGNTKFHNKKSLVHFFDGVTGLMQMLIFFLLGLLATPSQLPAVFGVALCIALFLTLIARPLAVSALLSPFRCKLRQQLLVSFAGLRGAASIVFAIMAIVDPAVLSLDLFHIVFCIVLLSITFQGSLLPLCAKLLKMTDASADVMKTFSDYTEEVDLQFIKVKMTGKHPWLGHAIREVTMLPDTLVVLIIRDGVHIVPDGRTVFKKNDIVVISAHSFNSSNSIQLKEKLITANSMWIGKKIREYSPNSGELVIMIIRGEKTIVPTGHTVIEKNDPLVINSSLPV